MVEEIAVLQLGDGGMGCCFTVSKKIVGWITVLQ